MDAHRGDIRELRHEMQLGFARVDARFEQVDARFEQLEARFGHLEGRLEQFEGRLEQFEGRFGQFEGRFGQLEVNLASRLESKLTALIEKSLRDQTRFFFVAWSVLLAMMVGLYSRG